MTEEIRVAVVVNPGLSPGLLANTVGAVSIGLGARLPALGTGRLSDRNGRRIDASSNRPVPVLQADGDALRALLLRALDRSDGGAVVAFPAFARGMHVFAEYEAAFPDRDLAEEAIDGLGLAGPAKWVRSLTGSLRLLR